MGCGTGHTTLSLAKNFPEASFLGIDLSGISIQKANSLASRQNMANVTFQKKDLREDLSGVGEFEIVLCLGVLHHIKNRQNVFRNIARLVKSGGYCVLWMYGRLGRFQHGLNQKFLKLLTKGNGRDKALDIARAFVEELGARFVRGTGFYTPKGTEEEGMAWLLDHPEWMADQMIPAYERSVSLKDILCLFRENELEFWKWLGVPTHLKNFTSSSTLRKRFEELSPSEKLLALDCLLKPSYYLVVGKKSEEDGNDHPGY